MASLEENMVESANFLLAYGEILKKIVMCMKGENPMADTEDVAKVLYEYITGTKYGEPVTYYNDELMLSCLESIVYRWNIDILDARAFARKYKAERENEPMSDMIVTFPTNPPFSVNCTHLAEELIRRLKINHTCIKSMYREHGSYYNENDSDDVEQLAKVIKAILQ